MPGNTGKARAFAFIIYPESWPTWERDLRGLHMPVVVSPVHDRDVFEEDDEETGAIIGELKKPHRHGIISWSGPVTLRNALNTLAPFGIEYVEPIGSYQGYCRYLCHMDDPDKAQYDRNDIVCLGGAVPDFEKKLTNAEMLEQRDRIIDWCVSHQVCEYAELVDAARNEYPDWRQDVYNNTVFWRGYLGSRRHLARCELEGVTHRG
jgi:hypothetical protein